MLETKNNLNNNITLSGDELDDILESSLAAEDDINIFETENREEVSLSLNEMDDILKEAELTEVEIESGETDATSLLSQTQEELDITPEVNDLDEELSSSDLPDLDVADIIPDADTSNLSDNSLEPESMEALDLKSESTGNQVSPEDESSIVALSIGELDNILEDVDESQIIDLDTDDLESISSDSKDKLKNDATEIVSLSQEELNNVTVQEKFDNITKKQGALFQADSSSKELFNSTEPPRSQSKSPLKKKKKAEKIPDPELQELLIYLDKLLDDLPEHRIKEFAESKYYDKYISIINRLGIK